MTAHATGAARLAPLVLATGASQALLVVLTPTIVQIGRDLDAPAGAVGQARTVTAAVAIAASLGVTARTDVLGVSRLLRLGCLLAIVACAGVAAAPDLALFLAAHALVGLAFAGLLSAGFAGVAAFPAQRRARAMGRVAAANAATWIVVNPVAGALTGWLSWRVAEGLPAVIAAATLLAARGAASAPAGRTPLRLRTLLDQVSARRWIVSELVAYGAWAAFLTFSGAFFLEVLGVRETVVGWLLAAGPVGYVVAATGGGRLVRALPRRFLVALAAAAMAVLLPVLLAAAGSVAAAVAVCFLVGLAAGVRTPASSRLGMAQLPEHPGAMMTARTAVTQAGYLAGAVVGGAMLSGPGYGALGFVLGVALAASSLLVLRVDDPATPDTEGTRPATMASPPATTGPRQPILPAE